MQKRFYLLFINIILSLAVANIFLIKINCDIGNSKFNLVSTFGGNAISGDINNINNIDNSKTYNISTIEFYNSFDVRFFVISISNVIKGVSLIKFNHIINSLFENKVANLIYKFTDNIKINIFFINAIIIFISILITYLLIYYLYKITIKFINLIEIKQAKIKANNYVTIIILLMAFCLFTVAYFTQYIDSGLFFNSDELFLLDILTDLKNGGSINNWYLPGAFEFFPDMMILALINLFTKDVYYLAYFYAVAQIMMFYVVIAYLINIFIAKKFSFYLASIFNFVCVFLAINFYDFSFLFIHSFHFQTFIKGLFITILILKFYKDNKISNVMLFILSVIQILGIISDRWLLLWFILPLLSCLIFLYFKDMRFKSIMSLKLGIVLTINIIIGFVLYKVLFLHGLNPEYYFIFQKKAFYHKVIAIFSGDLRLLLIMIFLFIFIISLKYNKYIINFYYENSLFRVSVLLFIASFILTFFALLVIYYFDLTNRYLIPITFISIMLFTFLIYQILGNFFTLSIILLLFGLMLFQTIGKNSMKYEYYPNDIKCVDNILRKYDVKHGIGEYWVSRHLNYINKSNIDVVPIETYKHIHRLWMENEKHKYDNYDFCVINSEIEINLNIVDIIQLNGKPIYTGKCGKYEIMIYNKGMLKRY